MITKVSRTIFNDAVANPLRRKALAFSILVKSNKNLAIFRDFTIREVARLTGTSPSTAKKYIRTLREMGLVSITRHANGDNYLAFKKLRKHKIKNKGNDLYHTPKFSDIDITKIDYSDIKTIEKGLMAIAIREKARKTANARHLIKLGTNPSRSDDLKEVKRARKICRKKGWERYVEHGLSYRKIRALLGCCPKTVRKIIIIGESLGLFEAHKPGLELVAFVGNYRAKEALPYFQCDFPSKHLFATMNNIYYQPPLTFTPFD